MLFACCIQENVWLNLYALRFRLELEKFEIYFVENKMEWNLKLKLMKDEKL